LGWSLEIDPGAGVVAAGEERERLGVLAVHVAEHDRPGVGLGVEKTGTVSEKVARPADTGAGVDNEARTLPSCAMATQEVWPP
jgi:hypothetical protein